MANHATDHVAPAPDWAGFDADLRQWPDVPAGAAAAARFTIGGVRPERVLRPVSEAQVCRIMEIASARGVAVAPAGLGARLGSGTPPRRPFAVVSLSSLNAWVDHQPANMTLTAQAGMTLADLQAAAARGGQWLPVDPPLPAATSVGGLIAANPSGPLRYSQGTVRDLLIGITVVRADGTRVKSGGRVVKNVAGYDLGKLYCGSMGTLGVVVEATFKVRALPEATAAARMTCGGAARARALLERILAPPLEPAFVELTARVPGAASECVLVVGFAGSRDDVAFQADTLKSWVAADCRLETLADAERESVLAELRDARAAAGAVCVLKVSVLPARLTDFIHVLEDESRSSRLALAVQAHAGNGIVHVRVSRPEGRDPREPVRRAVERLRGQAAALGGTLVVEQADPEVRPALDLWGGGIEGLALMRRVKETLDPGGVLSPGCFVGGI